MTQARLRNFVHGKRTDPCEAAYSEIVDPSTGKAYAHAPVSSAAGPERKFRKTKIPKFKEQNSISTKRRGANCVTIRRP